MRIPAPLLAAILAAVALLPGGAVRAGGDSFAKRKAEMLRGLRAKDPDERAEAVYALDGFDGPEAARALVRYVLAREDSPRVLHAALQLLGLMKKEESVRAIAEEAANARFPKKARVYEALGAIASEEAVPALLAGAYDDDARVRTSALLALRGVADDRADLALGDALDAREWPVRSAAISVLERRRSEVALPRLIQRLRPGAEPGRLYGDVLVALRRITRKRIGPSFEDWMRWYNRKRGKEPQPPGAYPEETPRRPTAELDGVKTYARQVLFVLAVNESMGEKITVDPAKVAPRDVREKGGKALEAWRSVKTKIELARLWIAWSIRHLSPEVSFDVVTYAVTPNAVFGEFVPATSVNREKAVRRIASLSASGRADLHAALMKIFTLVHRDPLDPKSLQGGPETVFFVSDGTSETGRVRQAYRAFEEAERLDRYRRIRFHCFGVGGSDDRVLADLAGMVPGGVFLGLR